MKCISGAQLIYNYNGFFTNIFVMVFLRIKSLLVSIFLCHHKRQMSGKESERERARVALSRRERGAERGAWE